MAGPAQVSVGGDGHGSLRMVGLEGPMAGLTGYSSLGVFPGLGVVAGSVALQARNLAAQLGPVTLEDGC